MVHFQGNSRSWRGLSLVVILISGISASSPTSRFSTKFPFAIQQSSIVASARAQKKPSRLAVKDHLFIRGGAQKGNASMKQGKAVIEKTSDIRASSTTSIKKTAMILGGLLASLFLFLTKSTWIGLFDKELLLEKTLQTLHHLDEQPVLISHTVYIIGMAIWEALGLSTIPVETASGMVFGWNGFYLSAIGKLLGAVAAFLIARHSVLATFIQKRLSTNEIIHLLESSAASHPIMVTILMKLSCFPETIKNYGSALLFPIRLWMFVAATAAHGWTFTWLWTYLGVDTHQRLSDSTLPVDRRLQVLLTLALVNGVIVSPLTMAYWIKSLRATKAAEDKQKQQGRNWWQRK